MWSPQRAVSDTEHRALIAHCFERDADRAAAALEKHIATARNALRRVLDE
jgi:DNA-binding GntR family transcriptional regulator